MELKDFFRDHPKVALGFSGGTDSVFLLYAGLKCGADIHPYFIKTPFQPRFEMEDAKRAVKLLGARLTILEYDVLSVPAVAENPKNRCYFCKTALFSLLSEQAKKDGYLCLIDGTNASDDCDDRPGMRALTELSVLSPLRLCGITKDTVRRLSKEAGLFTWDKPSYACLATRIPSGTKICREDLSKVERGEATLAAMGFSDFRLRLSGKDARLECRPEQMELAVAKRAEILRVLSVDFSRVTLDLLGR